jgi:hypothetical protein
MIALRPSPDTEVAIVTAIYLECLDDARKHPESRYCAAKLEAAEIRLRQVSAIAQQRSAA